MKTQFQKLVEESGHVCSPYSGQGIWRKEGLGVQANDLQTLIADILPVIAGYYEEVDLFAIADAFSTARVDNLYPGVMVYFPKIQYSCVDGDK